MLANTQRAYTLIEILITLTLMAVMATISIPALKSISDRTGDVILQARLLSIITRARVVALHSGWPVSLCHSRSGLACDGEWRDGLLLFIDRDKNGVIRHPHDVIAVLPLSAQRGALSYRAYPFYHAYLRMMKEGGGSADNGMFWYCHHGAARPSFAIVVNHSGLAHTMYPDQHGNIRDSHANMITCA